MYDDPVESAHGKLSPVDRAWTGTRFVGLLVVTLTLALALLYFLASVRSGEYAWDTFLAHDIVKHF